MKSIFLVLSVLVVSVTAQAAPRDEFEATRREHLKRTTQERITLAVNLASGENSSEWSIQLGEKLRKDWEERDSEGGLHRYTAEVGQKFWATSVSSVCEGELRNDASDFAHCLPR